MLRELEKLRITEVTASDVRFPTSRDQSGSDAMNPSPDYSAAYATLHTERPELSGHGFTFTIGRGNELCTAAIRSLAPLLVGKDLRELVADLGGFWRSLAGDSQLRWLGPEKGVIHLATAAVVNALWDLYAKAQGLPLWKLLAELSPEAVVAAVDFRYLGDALTREEALELLRRSRAGREERERHLLAEGYPAYNTSVGWSGYSDDQVRQLTRQALREGWGAFKLKVGRSLEEDRRRAALLRGEIGDAPLMFDANQVWEVDEAIAYVRALADFQPLWIEEPTSPDDILGHRKIAEAVRPIGVASGEHVHNRVMFKQFFEAGALDFCQLDPARLGGVNEALAVLLMAAKFGVPVCPHAGGVGLCEYVQHLSMFDYLAVSGSLEGRRVEYVGHLHQHFLDPVVIRRGCYQPPSRPGFSSEMRPESLSSYAFPDGAAWQGKPPA